MLSLKLLRSCRSPSSLSTFPSGSMTWACTDLAAAFTCNYHTILYLPILYM